MDEIINSSASAMDILLLRKSAAVFMPESFLTNKTKGEFLLIAYNATKGLPLDLSFKASIPAVAKLTRPSSSKSVEV